jgi:hypothetical protein
LEGVGLTTALEQALAEADLDTLDAATIELARTYADHIDDANEELSKLGPRLLTCLEALLLTPRARAKILTAGDDNEQPTNPVDELRDRRRQRGTPTMDTTAP